MDPLPQCFKSSVLGRSRLTLSIPVDHAFSLTLFNPMGCHPALFLLPITVLYLFLQKKKRCVPPTAPIAHFVHFLYGDCTVWLPPRYPLPFGPRMRSMRHVGGEVDQNNTFSERILPGALKGPGSGNAGG